MNYSPIFESISQITVVKLDWGD